MVNWAEKAVSQKVHTKSWCIQICPPVAVLHFAGIPVMLARIRKLTAEGGCLKDAAVQELLCQRGRGRSEEEPEEKTGSLNCPWK